ncbi:hypothetical protein TNCV_4730041 [Trichonephila clavipes]|nr:hypothetical protein TNCV_4730041 [Trichonephila clavipes]
MQVVQIGESLVIWVEAMRPLEYAVKNVMNPTSNSALTVIEDVSGEVQGMLPILLSLLHAPQTLNQELLSGVPLLLRARPF